MTELAEWGRFRENWKLLTNSQTSFGKYTCHLWPVTCHLSPYHHSMLLQLLWKSQNVRGCGWGRWVIDSEKNKKKMPKKKKKKKKGKNIGTYRLNLPRGQFIENLHIELSKVSHGVVWSFKVNCQKLLLFLRESASIFGNSCILIFQRLPMDL